MIPTVSLVAYLVISLAITVLVARTLHKNGRVFLLDSFRGNVPLADSVNHLLVVGFYLLNTGFVALAINAGTRPTTIEEAILSVSTKVGGVLIVLGTVHFVNLIVFSLFRKRAIEDRTRGVSDFFGESDYARPEKA